jgi:cation-transporting ATPase E
MTTKKEDVLQTFSHTIDPAKGLSSEEVSKRLETGQKNSTEVKVEKSYWKIFCDNFFTFFGCVLFLIAIVFVIFRQFLIANGHEDLAGTYFGISKFGYLLPLIINIVIGTIQECRSKRILDKLRLVSDSKYTVIRDGREMKVSSSEIVLDDIVKLEAGQQIPADMKVISGLAEVNEALLTGEADDVKKDGSEGHAALLSGSSVVTGSLLCQVTAVGKDTYANKLQKKVKNIVKNKSELMRNIYGIINAMSVVIFIIVTLVIVTMVYKINKWGSDSSVFITEATKNFISANYGTSVPSSISLADPYSWSVIITTASAFAIGVIPTGLVLLTSMTLAVSVIYLAKRQTLIQELYSLENLSRIDTICLDKTGTLTDGTMKVAEVIYIKHDEKNQKNLSDTLGAFLGAMPSNNQTSLALLDKFPANEKKQVEKLIPFSSSRKMSEVKFADGSDCCLGAPEYVIGEKDKKSLATVQDKAASGFRVVAFTVNGELEMLICLSDNIRSSAPSTIRYFNENGVDVKIISGDNPVTVKQIASQCGVKDAEKYISLEGVPVEAIDSLIDKYVVFGRVSPEQKEALVFALQKRGKKVAMTGDGVNDILALRKANSSISFQNATDAAKSCADVVLMDNDFGHLKEVVTQGRRVVNNIERTAILFLMKTFCIILLAFMLVPFKKGQSEFTIENLYLVQKVVIAIAGFLLSLETCSKPIAGSFKTTVYSKAIASGLLMASGAIIPCLLNVGFNGQAPVMTSDNARSMISLLTTLAGLTVLLKMCMKFTRYRLIVFLVSVSVAIYTIFAFPSIYVGGRSWSLVDIIKNGWNSELFRNFFNIRNSVFLSMGNAEFITLGCFVVVALPLYILSMKGIDVVLNKKLLAQRS